MDVIVCVNENSLDEDARISQNPESCPLCHRTIMPLRYKGFLDNDKQDTFDGDISLQIVFRCPHSKCRGIFIGLYCLDLYSQRHYNLVGSRPWNNIAEKHSSFIESVSKDFVIIYNQSSAAEQQGLGVICGTGYRKSLEFLIKDYLIKKNPKKEKEIKKSFLGPLVEKEINNQNIKVVAKRAVWLGNDETHYERKWEGKDVQDLKMLIDLTVKWIETEELTEKLLADMPDKI
ncbi:MAG: hypothetical protein WDA75_21075 [Candidatus Latescibacterota bacterium]|jgi:hypothetical protein